MFDKFFLIEMISCFVSFKLCVGNKGLISANKRYLWSLKRVAKHHQEVNATNWKAFNPAYRLNVALFIPLSPLVGLN